MQDVNIERTSPLLEIKDLVLEAEQSSRGLILDHVDLTLRRGEVVGLIGESGAGKSTLGLSALGFFSEGIRRVSGSITFDGIDLTTLSERELRMLRGERVSYVAQSAAASLNPAYRIISQYTEIPTSRGIRSRAQAQDDAKELYKKLLLPDPNSIGYRFPHQLSGGQLQRAMIAMAMACQPELIVFDEPTTALDVTTQVEVLSAIKAVVEKGDTAALYITHDLAVVSQVADRVMVLRNGKMVEVGETKALVRAPTQPYTRDLLNVVPEVRSARPRPQAPPILTLKDVSAAYGEFEVLRRIDLDVYKKRTVAIVGESGSGKSSLARVVAGLLPPKTGQIMLEGAVLAPTVKQRSKEALRRIQLIPQMADTALNPKQTVKEILSRPLEFYGGVPRSEQSQRISELLAMIELRDEYALRYPRELSGGEKQRVSIARALAADPDILLCDEVTSALDQLVARDILALLKNLQERIDTAFVFISHDMNVIKAIADDVVVMKGGEIVENGYRDDVMSPPHHPYTELLLSSVPQMDPGWLDGLLAQRGIRAQA